MVLHLLLPSVDEHPDLDLLLLLGQALHLFEFPQFALLLLFTLLLLFEAPAAEPLAFRDGAQTYALVVSQVEVTVIADHDLVFTIVLSADPTASCHL